MFWVYDLIEEKFFSKGGNEVSSEVWREWAAKPACLPRLFCHLPFLRNNFLLLLLVLHHFVFHFKFSTTYPHTLVPTWRVQVLPPFLCLQDIPWSLVWAPAVASDMSAQGLGYWLQWQVGLCAVIIAGPSILALKYVRNSKQEPLNSVDLWSTCWKSVDPIWLLFYRAFAFLCMAKMLYDFLALFPVFTLVFYTQ